MSTHPDLTNPTVALTVVGNGPAGKSDLFVVVYFEQGDARQSRVVALAEGTEITFGRSRGCTVVIDHDRVSRQHTKITRDGESITVEDLGSRNGTFLNGQRLEARTTARTGDEIGVGPATCVIGGASAMRRRPGLGTTGFLADRLAAETDRCQRYGRSLALVMLRTSASDAEIESIDRLMSALRPMDVIAEYGPDELAVLLPESDARAASEVVNRWISEFRAAGAVGLWAGIAAVPEHGRAPDELLAAARTALREARAQSPKGGASATAAAQGRHAEVHPVIADASMVRVYHLVERIAASNITVLVLGETGVGKELVADALHRRSPRAAKPFVKLNCASLPETLLESELFGHEKGSFTGAERRKHGYFEAADGGTIFLDEIGEMPLPLQAKLLRVLEQRVITRVGGTESIEVDVRVVAATNRNLETEVIEGRFRQDLYFRVSAFTVAVPPLRDRHAEVPLLVARFCEEFARDLGHKPPVVSPASSVLLSRYAWPGNVRELRNAIERAVVLQSGGVIEPVHLPDRVREGEFVATGPSDSAKDAAPAGAAGLDGGDIRDHLAEVERASIAAALDAERQNQTRAAQRLGISRRALIYKMEKYGLKPPPASR